MRRFAYDGENRLLSESGPVARRHLTYKDVVKTMGALGISETEPNLRNKISRGGFSAAFFVQCLVAIGAHTVRLHEAE